MMNKGDRIRLAKLRILGLDRPNMWDEQFGIEEMHVYSGAFDDDDMESINIYVDIELHESACFEIEIGFDYFKMYKSDYPDGGYINKYYSPYRLDQFVKRWVPLLFKFDPYQDTLTRYMNYE